MSRWSILPLALTTAACVGPALTPSDTTLPVLREESFDNCPVPALDIAARVVAATDWPAHLASADPTGHPLIDWTYPPATSLVFVSAGHQPSQGYQIARQGPVRLVDGVLQVQVRLATPPPGAFVAQSLSSPCLYLLVQGRGGQLQVAFGEADLPALAPP